ncbi:MAG: tetratricopeptide repeat protein [Erythrobacter sp.]
MMITSAAIAALLLAGADAPQPEPNQTVALSSENIAQGRTEAAITSLERSVAANPDDPGLLINLGIAHAHAGSPDTARDLFERALLSDKPVELETADGKAIDSRRLARKALRMLERGEFSPTFSRRD